MGGGRQKFLPKSGNSSHGFGSRLDKDLIQEWKKDKIQRKAKATYVTTLQELQNIEINTTDYLLGIKFKYSHFKIRFLKSPTLITIPF